MAHAPGLVRHGSKPAREIAKRGDLLGEITSHLRSYEEAVAYPPNQAFLGGMHPDSLSLIERPWFQANGGGQRWSPFGEIMPEDELYGLLKIADAFDLVTLEEGFAAQVRNALSEHKLIQEEDLKRLNEGQPYSTIEKQAADTDVAIPLYLRDGRLVGYVNRAHEEDASLTADVVLENLACKATAVMALRTLIYDQRIDPSDIEYVLNTGEEAVGERYQRGGRKLGESRGGDVRIVQRFWRGRQGFLLRTRPCVGHGWRPGEFGPLPASRGCGWLFLGQAGDEIPGTPAP